ncbi:CDP-alcohol phosphatidyltransferase [Niastella koreensis]|uniref:CDP-alcohol phosphatidyltransferase n=2 Tax=Niastella koreensis TaxID=354356 RepID=G8TJ94_NIAKG|nr:CDP-alcohol phosphatidyltransferase [Niastella koreensis GR20-10]OQP53318.1 CDP-alcohol phosphatidyltransferase [Niastella koreensis]
MNKSCYYIVNGITLYRLMMVPVLIGMVFMYQVDLFKWLLAISFFSDLIDGWLARRYHATSIIGAKLDSAADDLTFVAGIVAVVVLKPEFLKQQAVFVIILVALFLTQTALAIFRYQKITSFHTWLAKCAALMQGTFLILLFFLPRPVELIFYIAFTATAADLLEEIVLVVLLPEWKANVKGLYWVLKKH